MRQLTRLIGPFLDVFLHDAGHATFSILHIPVFGREEDAADQFSTYLMLKFQKDEARRLMVGSTDQYKGDLTSSKVTIPQLAFADQHGTPAQRLSICSARLTEPIRNYFAMSCKKDFYRRTEP